MKKNQISQWVRLMAFFFIVLLSGIKLWQYSNLGYGENGAAKAFPFLAEEMQREGIKLAIWIASLFIMYILFLVLSFWKSDKEKKRIKWDRQQYQELFYKMDCIAYEWDIWEDCAVFSPQWKGRYGSNTIERDFLKSIGRHSFLQDAYRSHYYDFLNSVKMGNPYAELIMPLIDQDGNVFWYKNCLVKTQVKQGYSHYAVGILINMHSQQMEINRLRGEKQIEQNRGIL